MLRCTTKLVSLLAVSVQLKLILLDDPAIAVKPVGAFGVVTEAGDVSLPLPQDVTNIVKPRMAILHNKKEILLRENTKSFVIHVVINVTKLITETLDTDHSTLGNI